MNKYEKKLKWIENYEYDSMEELKEIVELVERATPKKVDIDLCPICGCQYGFQANFCNDCGQALDWS